MSDTQVNCSIERVDLPNDNGAMKPSTRLTCSRCSYVVECLGQRGRSTRRCLTMLREGCPKREANTYKTQKS